MNAQNVRNRSKKGAGRRIAEFRHGTKKQNLSLSDYAARMGELPLLMAMGMTTSNKKEAILYFSLAVERIDPYG